MESKGTASELEQLRTLLTERVLSKTKKKELEVALKDPYIGGSIRILFSSMDSMANFLTLHSFLKKHVRSTTAGAPMEIEQDLLRAMLLFSGAGLDSALKELTKKLYPEVVKWNPVARTYLENYVEGEMKDMNRKGARELLTRLLLSESPQQATIDKISQELCSESLQSTKQLFKIANIFGVDDKIIKSREKLLNEIFRVRQEIAHEMDVNMLLPNRKRRRRKKDLMFKYSKELIILGLEFIQEALSALSSKPSVSSS